MNDYRKGYADGLRAALELYRMHADVDPQDDDEDARFARLLLALANITDPEGD